jgi:hypothetical protein
MITKFITSSEELQTYVRDLDRFLKVELGQPLPDPRDVAEAVFDVMLGSRSIRQGRAPDVQRQANIMGVIKRSIAEGVPIPVLVPSGPKKTLASDSVDVAEMAMLGILDCVNRRVSRLYEPGIRVSMRMEVLSGYYIEGKSREVVDAIARYVPDMEKLIRVLGMGKLVLPFSEADKTTEADFFKVADEFYAAVLPYLIATDGLQESTWERTAEYERVRALGWTGIVPGEMRQHLYAKYDRLVPGIDFHEAQRIAARYLSAAVARKVTKSTGTEPEGWGGLGSPIELVFSPPTPGVPDGIHAARNYLRSVPMEHSKSNVFFCRGKGILKVDRSGRVRYSIVSYRGLEELDLRPGQLEVSGNGETMRIGADVLLTD